MYLYICTYTYVYTVYVYVYVCMHVKLKRIVYIILYYEKRQCNTSVFLSRPASLPHRTGVSEPQSPTVGSQPTHGSLWKQNLKSVSLETMKFL